MISYMNQTFTLKQVAERVSRTKEPEDIERLMRQIRHWTLCDLMLPVGGKHTGTGRSRRYDADEVRVAAVLAELTRYGMTVTLLDGMREGWSDQMRMWREATSSTEPIFYEVVWDEYTMMCKPNYGRIELISRESDRVGSRKLQDGAEDDEWPQGSIFNPANIESGIVLNLTKIFTRLELD